MLAPRNEAFEIMNEDAMKELLASPDLMKKFMERITIPQTLEASDLTDGATIKTSGSETLTVTKVQFQQQMFWPAKLKKLDRFTTKNKV